MIYHASAVYQQEDFIGFMKAYADRVPTLRGTNKVSRIVCKAAGIIMMLSGLINCVTDFLLGTFIVTNGLIYLVMVVGGVLLLRLKVDDIPGRRMWNKYEGQGATIGFEFYDDSYKTTRQGSEKERGYDEIAGLYCDGDRYYLFLSEETADIIRIDSFKTGDPEAFALFIKGKTGLEWEGIDPIPEEDAEDEEEKA